MKSKIHKILGVALTLVMLGSLTIGLFAMPAAAGTLEWDKSNPPKAGEDGDYFRDIDITGLGPMAMAIDGSLYAYADGVGLLKSTDDGRSWERLTKYDFADPVDIAVSTEDADHLWIATADTVYRTTNGGDTYTALTTVTGPTAGTLSAINSIAAGYVNDELQLFVSATGGDGEDVYVLAASYGSIWSTMAAQAAGAVNVYHVAAAPDFNSASDPLLLAVVDDGTDTLVYYKEGGGAWNGNKGPLQLVAGATTVDATDIAFPDDFESDPESGFLEYFIVLDDGVDANQSLWNVVVDSEWGSNDTTIDDFVSVDVSGSAGDASVMAGTDGGTVYYSTNNGISWDEARDNPSGDGNAMVLMTQDFLETEEAWALVDGSQHLQALSFTQDGGDTFNQISLIDTSIGWVEDIAFGSDRYVVTDPSGGGDDSVWRDDGDNWERVAVASDIDRVATSPEY
jgi:hypothetical protein